MSAESPPRSYTPTARIRLIRAADSVFDAMGMRPLGIAVFLASAALLMLLVEVSGRTIRADAVALAKRIDHPSRVASFVTAIFVKPGDRVEVGAPLVELSPYFIEQSLARLDSQLEQLINESKLAQARLLVDEERWVPSSMRTQPGRPSLEAPTEAFYSKQIETLSLRRKALLADLDALRVTSQFGGVVAEVLWLGASVAEGVSVASVMPEFAEEIVAYLPAMADPASIPREATARIIGTKSEACQSPALVRGYGAG